MNNNYCPGAGKIPCRYMLIGEAAGSEEIAYDPPTPFIGQAGRLLMDCLANIKLCREDFYISNILKWKPPYNRDPFNFEIDAAMPELMAEILTVDPQCIVTAGRFATAVFVEGKYEIKMKDYQVSENDPFFWHSKLIIPVYHPAYGVYSSHGRSQFIDNMYEVGEILSGRRLVLPNLDSKMTDE